MRVSLALSGGGSLGAYSAGVLHTLLENEELEIEGVTGASAGAIDAALLGMGLARGGRDGARDLLKEFWEEVAAVCAERRRPRWRGSADALRRVRDSGSIRALQELAIRSLADYVMDPATMEPLRGLLERHIHSPTLGDSCPLRVFINATHALDLEPKVFAGDEIDANAILASSCVPLLFDAVTVDGEPYWDGGFIGNPAIYPVINHCDANDILLVRTSATASELPRSAGQLLSRVIEVACLSALKRELRAIDFVSELARDTRNGVPGGPREIRVHHLEIHPALEELKRGGAFNASSQHLGQLFQIGREAGANWRPA